MAVFSFFMAAPPLSAQTQLGVLEEELLGRCPDIWPAQQGIAFGAGAFYTSAGTCFGALAPATLSKWISTPDGWDLDESRFIGDFLDCHVGDISFDEDHNLVIAPVTDIFSDYLIWCDPNTLDIVEFLDATNLRDIYEYEDLAGVAYYDGRVYVVTYQDDEQIPTYIFVYDYLGEFWYGFYEIDTHYANGLAFVGDWVYVSRGPTSERDRGWIDLYRLEDLQAGESAYCERYEYPVVACDANPFRHAEGLTFRGGQLWTAQWEYAVHLQSTEFPPGLWLEEQKLLASDGEPYDSFGGSVSVSGDVAVIGARWDDDNGYRSGSAYVFERVGGVWQEQAKLTASDGAAHDRFGHSVSVSGDVAVVGPYFIRNVIRDDDNATDSGSAYIFERVGGVWPQTETQKLTASDGEPYDNFGRAVSVSGDVAVIGAYGDDDRGDASGSAYVFERVGGLWQEQAKLTASDGEPYDSFGYSVSVSGDVAVIGAFRDDDNGSESGSAYVFERVGGVWQEQAKLTASDASPWDYFGYHVSVSGDVAVIGALRDGDNGTDSGSVYVFEKVNGVWPETETQKLTASDGASGDNFGQSISISGDVAVIGAYRDDDRGDASGSAYVFERVGGLWQEQAKLTASDGAPNDSFGSVSVSGDVAVIGANRHDDNGTDSGSAYVFEATTTACRADLDGDGDADADDFFAYLDAFAAGDLAVCDIDGDGDCDADDFFRYLDLFAAGC